jgi:glycosyltransferase involved in cell wall biosynthesis
VVDPPDHVARVADAIIQLVVDPARRAAMGAAARQRIIDRFDYDLLADQLRASIAHTIERLAP